MKKLIPILISVILVLIITACNNDDAPLNENVETAPESTSPSENELYLDELEEYLKSFPGYDLSSADMMVFLNETTEESVFDDILFIDQQGIVFSPSYGVGYLFNDLDYLSLVLSGIRAVEIVQVSNAVKAEIFAVPVYEDDEIIGVLAGSIETLDFSNTFGTPTTMCALSGCNRHIAPSGNTHNCIAHSNKCLECTDYIDGDAAWCLSCLENAAAGR
jgi:hypothetical protein